MSERQSETEAMANGAEKASKRRPKHQARRHLVVSVQVDGEDFSIKVQVRWP